MDTSNLIQTVSVYAIPVIFAITLHEAAHGYAAKYLGDRTAMLRAVDGALRGAFRSCLPRSVAKLLDDEPRLFRGPLRLAMGVIAGTNSEENDELRAAAIAAVDLLAELLAALRTGKV